MDQKRFILAMVLSAGVILVWQMFFGPEPPSPDQNREKAAQTADESPEGDQATETSADRDSDSAETDETSTEASADDEKADGAAETDGGEPIGEPVVEQAEPEKKVSEQTHTLRSDQLAVTLSNTLGGRVTAAELLSPEQYAKRGDLLSDFPENSEHYPYRVGFADGKLPVPSDATYEFVESASQKADGDGWAKVVYRFTDPKGRFEIDKVYQFDDEAPYVVTMDVRIKNNLDDVKLTDTVVVDMYGYKDPNQESSFLNFRPNTVEGVCRTPQEVFRSSISDVEEALEYGSAEITWGAIDTRYFMLAAVPSDAAQRCVIERVGDGYLRTRTIQESFSARPGETATSSHKLYMGPKDIDILHEVGHELTDSVDYGLFAFIAKPLRWALSTIHNYVGNWGIAILLLTIIIKLLTWPINMKAYRNMEDMKKIQPKLEEVREKYEDDRQRMTEETMKLFRENDVSPMGGCLPMLLQMPILYGLYVMIYYSVDIYHADFALWYTNLAEPDPYYVLPILMGIVMFVQQGMMTGATGNTQAKVMTKVMPFMFTAFMLFLPSGLVLYYSTNLAIGLGQQFYIRDMSLSDLTNSDDES